MTTKVKVQHSRYTATYKKQSADDAEFELREDRKLVVSTRMAPDGHITFGPRAFPLVARAIDWTIMFFNRLLERPQDPPQLRDKNDVEPR